MNPDTSLKRIVLMLVLSVLALPYILQVFMSPGRLFISQEQLEVESVLFEVKGFARLVTQYQNANNRWPESLAEISPTIQPSGHLSIDLSTENQVIGTITELVLNDQLTGHQVVFIRGLGWHCDRQRTTLPEDLKPVECGGQLSSSLNQPPNESTFSVIAFFAILGIIISWVFFHPAIRTLRSHGFLLTSQRFNDLGKLKTLTQLAGLRQQLLQANELTLRSWRAVVAFKRLDLQQKTAWLCRAWGASKQPKANHSTWVIKLDPDFPLNVEALYWITPKPGTTITRINHQLQQLKDAHRPVMLWVEDAAYNAHLQLNKSRIKANFLLPNSTQMTQLLVPKLAQQCLLDVLVESLPLNHLSPFQGRGGLLKSSQFFGRERIMTELVNNPRACFLMVGGRQLGKTSILKAYERSLSRHAHSQCFYISMSDERLLPRLAHHLKILEYENLTDLLTQYQQAHPHQQLVILLDEADRFIARQAQQDYPLLGEIKACAEQGLGQMVFGGFWDLYASVVLDYHSPLRNFAQILTVGALEKAPAKALLHNPMTLMKQQFQSPQLLEKLLHLTGQRANLLNLVGEHLVEQLTHQPQIIDETLVMQALRCQSVHDALQGWSNLSRNPLDSAIDRMLVYLTFMHQRIDLSLVMSHFQQADKAIGPEQLKQSLHRLRLAHILHQQDRQYRFAVPLFAEQHGAAEAESLLQQELRLLPA